MADAAPAKSPKKPAAKKKPAEHPKYSEMVLKAAADLKDRKGSSRQAIVKYIKANYKVADNASLHVKNALKKCVVAGTLAQASGTGASGRFKAVPKKAAPKPKKAKKPKAAKKPKKAKKSAAKKSPKKAAKKPAAKKTAAKKPAAKKTAAKKPAKKPAAAKKPAKKPAAKKTAKKPAAKKPAAKKPAAKKAAKK